MTLVALSAPVPYGIGVNYTGTSNPGTSSVTLDAAKEASIVYGHVVTADGGSHTIDTSGSSSLQWRTAAVTFANAGTTVVVGLAAMDTSTGPPGRAVNSTDTITFDVSRSITGGGGGITANAWQTNVPTSGSKTIANGDYLAFAVQMTTRGGADSVIHAGTIQGNNWHLPGATNYTGGSYATGQMSPSVIIVFSDGTLGWFYTAEVASSFTTRTFNSGSSPNEYGQLYSLPFPARISGVFGWIDPDADCDFVLYSDPLGTPSAQKTVSLDANTGATSTPRRFWALFPSYYDVAANTPIAAVFKPGASNISAYLKTLGSATHRVTDSSGTSSYGVSRSSGAFADANSSLDHYYIGLLLSGFEHGVWPTYAVGM